MELTAVRRAVDMSQRVVETVDNPCERRDVLDLDLSAEAYAAINTWVVATGVWMPATVALRCILRGALEA